MKFHEKSSFSAFPEPCANQWFSGPFSSGTVPFHEKAQYSPKRGGIPPFLAFRVPEMRFWAPELTFAAPAQNPL